MAGNSAAEDNFAVADNPVAGNFAAEDNFAVADNFVADNSVVEGNFVGYNRAVDWLQMRHRHFCSQ